MAHSSVLYLYRALHRQYGGVGILPPWWRAALRYIHAEYHPWRPAVYHPFRQRLHLYRLALAGWNTLVDTTCYNSYLGSFCFQVGLTALSVTFCGIVRLTFLTIYARGVEGGKYPFCFAGFGILTALSDFCARNGNQQVLQKPIVFATLVNIQYSLLMEKVSTMSLAFHRKPNGSRRISNRQIDFVGWVLFVLSATAFIIASIGSFWAMCGSVFFLLACLVFIIPFFRNG